jgi:hypothetical protein
MPQVQKYMRAYHVPFGGALFLRDQNQNHIYFFICPDKYDDFSFAIVNFPFLCSNTQLSPVYGVYISKLIQYTRACYAYDNNTKLMLQVFKSWLCNFYSRYTDFVCHWPMYAKWFVSYPLLALMMGNPVYLISTKGAWRMWPVSRRCLLLHGTVASVRN